MIQKAGTIILDACRRDSQVLPTSLKDIREHKASAGCMVSTCLSETMERSTGDKRLALEALLLFDILLLRDREREEFFHPSCLIVILLLVLNLLTHTQHLSWNTTDNYSRTNFLNSETTNYYNLSWIFVQRHETPTSLQSLGTSSYLMFFVCFSSCIAEVPWRRWWEQRIILLPYSGNSYSRHMLGQGYEIICVPDINVTINW